jgi:hypothetical protein
LETFTNSKKDQKKNTMNHVCVSGFLLFIYLFIPSKIFEIIFFWFSPKLIYTWKKINPKLSQFFCPKSDKICQEKITGILYNENNDACVFEAFIPTHCYQPPWQKNGVDEQRYPSLAPGMKFNQSLLEKKKLKKKNHFLEQQYPHPNFIEPRKHQIFTYPKF